MASEVTTDGHVLPALNISAPVPLLNLRGFKWDTVDTKIHGPQPSQDDGQLSTEQASLVDHFKPSFKLAAVPPPLAPQLPLETGALPAQLGGQLGHVSGKPAPLAPDFPLAQFQGAYAGNGFNMIFRPRSNNDTTFTIKPPGNDDNILELNLTTEQLTFGATLGNIPNRGFGPQPDITLTGLPYLQTVQDVTNLVTGKGDSLNPTDIHFEPGIWLNVPKATFHTADTGSVVRMASIPHGTTVNAQGLVPKSGNGVLGGVTGRPKIDDVDTTPFFTKNPSQKQNFPSMDAGNQNTFRLPQNLDVFIDKGTITTGIIKNPNLVLQNAIKDQTITETISFEVSTGPPTAELNGGGTANISFLAGKQALATTVAPESPIAHAAFMKSKFWIETVAYQVNVPKTTTQTTMLLMPTMPSNCTAPTPVFAITTPPSGVPEKKLITVPGIQIQSSQTVNLIFGPLTWPHVSVATLVPTGPQPFRMT